MRGKRLRVLVAAMIAVVGLAIPGAASAARPDSRSLSFNVVDAAGRGVPGAKVVVSTMWGTERLWGEHGKSESRALRSDKAGKVSLRMALSDAEKEAAAANGGWLNLSVTTIDENGFPSGDFAFSRYVGTDPQQAAQEDVNTRAGKTIRVKSSAATAQRAAVDAAQRGSQTTGSVGAKQLRPQAAISAVTAAYTNCTNYHWEVYSTDWDYTHIGDLHTAGDTTASHLYGTSSDASMDVGYKTGTGPWGISGTAHSGESLGQTYGLNAGANFHWGVYAPFNYVLLFMYADCFEGNHLYMSHQQVEEDGYHTQNSLSKQIVASQPARNTAHPEWALKSGPDSSYHRYSNKFRKYSAAFSVWGFSAGAESGASVNSDQTWTFGHGQTWHWLYGNGVPYTTAGVIYASNN